MAQNAKDIQLRDLKDLTNELRETNRLLKKTLEESQKREEELKQERDNLKGQIDYLTKKLFGSSSEKASVRSRGRWIFLMRWKLLLTHPWKMKTQRMPLKKTRKMYPKRAPEKSVQLIRNVIKESL